MGKILVVDDDQLIRQIAEDILLRNGHAVFKAKDPIEGLHILKSQAAEVVLLDVVMAVASGFKMIPQIKDINNGIEIIIMTALASTDSAVEAIRAGAYDYIRKPLQPEELLHSASKALERNRLVNENRALLKRLKKADEVKENRVNSELGVGTTFSIELPVEMVAAESGLAEDLFF
jgi:DNA-binding NtrC family response regulator